MLILIDSSTPLCSARNDCEYSVAITPVEMTDLNHRFRLGRKAVPPGGQVRIKEIVYGPAAVPQAKQG